MSDDDTEERDDEASIEELSLAQASSTYKVRGEFADDTGTGVLGKNTSGSGTPIGVEGAVPNTSGGYGLSTPHDANVTGTAELGGLSGGVTGNTEITNLLGESLGIDGSNTLQVQSAYRTNSFSSAGIDWNPFSGLPSGTPVEVTYDTRGGLNAGQLLIDVDGALQIREDANRVNTRVFGASSVTIKSRKDFGYDTNYDPSEDSSPIGVTFKGDGTKMYVSGNSNDSVYEYALSTAWDLDSASYNNASLDVSSEDTTPSGLAFKSDGGKMFLAGESNGKVYSYSFSTDWDLSSASSLRSFNPAPPTVSDVEFKSDGTKLFLSNINSAKVTTYELNTAWDIGTATNKKEFDLSESTGSITGLAFKDDGTKLFNSRDFVRSVYQWNLSTAWDLSSRSFIKTTSVSNLRDPQDMAVKGDGTRAFFAERDNGDIQQASKKFDGTVYATAEKERP